MVVDAHPAQSARDIHFITFIKKEKHLFIEAVGGVVKPRNQPLKRKLLRPAATTHNCEASALSNELKRLAENLRPLVLVDWPVGWPPPPRHKFPCVKFVCYEYAVFTP